MTASRIRWLSVAVNCFLGWIAVKGAAAQDSRLLDPGSHLIGPSGGREWREFEGREVSGARLDVLFDAQVNSTEHVFLIRQRDVKLEWHVEVNGRRLGELSL